MSVLGAKVADMIEREGKLDADEDEPYKIAGDGLVQLFLVAARAMDQGLSPTMALAVLLGGVSNIVDTTIGTSIGWQRRLRKLQ